MDFYWQRAKLLANVGGKNKYGVLMIDYRGYGMSEGKPSEEGMYTDVNTALNWLKKSGLTNDRLVMYGFSLGTAPACELTANTRDMVPSILISRLSDLIPIIVNMQEPRALVNKSVGE